MDCCSRRSFMKSGALALLGIGSVPRFLVRTAYAQGTAARPKILIALFQRGAVDGLSMIVPHGDRDYYGSRGSIAVVRPAGACPTPRGSVWPASPNRTARQSSSPPPTPSPAQPRKQ